jgi:hypothetical protein
MVGFIEVAWRDFIMVFLWIRAGILWAGASWLPASDFLGSLAISSFAHDAGNPAVIYAVTSEFYYTATQGIGVLKVHRRRSLVAAAARNWSGHLQ